MRNTILIVLILCACAGCTWNNNKDNTIYIPGNKYHFRVQYLDSTGEVTKEQPMDLTVTDGFYPERKQTEIIWELYNENGDSIIARNETGVVDGDEYFIHQPRIDDMYILSFAAFPSISKAVVLDPTLERTSTGSVVMAKQYNGTTITEVATTQATKGTTTINLPGIGERTVCVTESTATSALGTIYGTNYFDKELGFVKMLFTLPGNSKINIEMTGE